MSWSFLFAALFRLIAKVARRELRLRGWASLAVGRRFTEEEETEKVVYNFLGFSESHRTMVLDKEGRTIFDMKLHAKLQKRRDPSIRLARNTTRTGRMSSSPTWSRRNNSSNRLGATWTTSVTSDAFGRFFITTATSSLSLSADLQEGLRQAGHTELGSSLKNCPQDPAKRQEPRRDGPLVRYRSWPQRVRGHIGVASVPKWSCNVEIEQKSFPTTPTQVDWISSGTLIAVTAACHACAVMSSANTGFVQRLGERGTLSHAIIVGLIRENSLHGSHNRRELLKSYHSRQRFMIFNIPSSLDCPIFCMLFRCLIPQHDTYYVNTVTRSLINENERSLDVCVYVDLGLGLTLVRILRFITISYLLSHHVAFSDTNRFVILLHLTRHLQPDVTLNLTYMSLRHLTHLA